MTAADTAMVIALSAALGGFRPMATVGQTITFMRPISGADVLVTARVLRGLLLGMEPMAQFGAPIAPSLAQGSMVMICDRVETLVIDGSGQGERA
jgi:hypothetical protein